MSTRTLPARRSRAKRLRHIADRFFLQGRLSRGARAHLLAQLLEDDFEPRYVRYCRREGRQDLLREERRARREVHLLPGIDVPYGTTRLVGVIGLKGSGL